MTHDDVVAAVYERNRVIGYKMARHLGSRDPEDSVQDASIILWRMPRITPDPTDQDGLWRYCLRLSLLRERRLAGRRARLGAQFPLSLIEADDNVDHPRSSSAESVVLAGLISPRLMHALRRMTPYHQARLARRLTADARAREPFAPAVKALTSAQPNKEATS